MPDDGFTADLVDFYRQIDADLAEELAANDLAQLRRLARKTLEQLADIDLTALSEDLRLLHKENLGRMLLVTVVIQPAFQRWLKWRAEEEGRELAPEEVNRELLMLLVPPKR